MSFAHLLTARRHSLYLPKDARDDVARLVSVHQQTKTTRKMTPFRRQVDFWLLCLGVALAKGLPQRDGLPSAWGYKFVDTTQVQLPTEIYNLLVVIAFEELGHDADAIDDPAQIIDTANRLSGAACSQVLGELTSKDLRITPLDKALRLARRALG